ncbi:zinc ribbon domain-containing protein YjdM [Pseudogracilibacillus auburnensis]|uniref:Alkylphosphonate utilization operon protein PhnA n=1 Tax=Pseudogracilibacillus auburnensis TaxID=1494959 RepID=A0A2V3VYK6_9BACI|nr:zinc ribbon domain-containing protein YjdM [Pseudogracilibacillus auburnensis]MBO1002654.1 alkylphosphonate utilization protein [Pseudogracilibacillus auburnensis]PXW86690.1 alkylphosphonate utilization operon protein PhnA [Pseudogracilibacillus auburnensis]
MANLPNCPQCQSAYTYEDGHFFVCPECAHEWSDEADTEVAEENITRDAFGNELQDGDQVTVIKDLKVKGSSDVVKQGTNIKGIRIIDGDHDIDCRVPGHGNMQLKSEFLKKI